MSCRSGQNFELNVRMTTSTHIPLRMTASSSALSQRLTQLSFACHSKSGQIEVTKPSETGFDCEPMKSRFQHVGLMH